jgi:hypothetical protein
MVLKVSATRDAGELAPNDQSPDRRQRASRVNPLADMVIPDSRALFRLVPWYVKSNIAFFLR